MLERKEELIQRFQSVRLDENVRILLFRGTVNTFFLP